MVQERVQVAVPAEVQTYHLHDILYGFTPVCQVGAYQYPTMHYNAHDTQHTRHGQRSRQVPEVAEGSLGIEVSDSLLRFTTPCRTTEQSMARLLQVHQLALKT